MYVYVCMCMYVCIYVCMYVWIFVCLFIIYRYNYIIQVVDPRYRVVYINISWEQLDRYSSDYYLATDEEYKTVMEMCGAMEIIIWTLMKTNISNIHCVTKVVDSSLSTETPWIFSKYVLCYYAYFLASWRPIFKYVIWLWKKIIIIWKKKV